MNEKFRNGKEDPNPPLLKRIRVIDNEVRRGVWFSFENNQISFGKKQAIVLSYLNGQRGRPVPADLLLEVIHREIAEFPEMHDLSRKKEYSQVNLKTLVDSINHRLGKISQNSVQILWDKESDTFVLTKLGLHVENE